MVIYSRNGIFPAISINKDIIVISNRSPPVCVCVCVCVCVYTHTHIYMFFLIAQTTWNQSLVQEDPWRREWLPTPIFLPGEFHGHRRLACYSPWGRKESDANKQLTHTFFWAIPCSMWDLISLTRD